VLAEENCGPTTKETRSRKFNCGGVSFLLIRRDGGIKKKGAQRQRGVIRLDGSRQGQNICAKMCQCIKEGLNLTSSWLFSGGNRCGRKRKRGLNGMKKRKRGSFISARRGVREGRLAAC